MTGTHTHHSASASDILRGLIAEAGNGETGLLKTKLHTSKIQHIHSAVKIITWTSGVMVFEFEGRRYTEKVGKPTTANKQRDIRTYILTWDHR